MERNDRARLTPGEGRRFGFTLGTAFLVFGGIMGWRGHGTLSLVLLTTGAVLCLGAIAFPARLGPVQRAWMGMAHALSRVTTPIFMGIVYYLVLTPVGLVRRALSRNPLDHRNESGSFWQERSPEHRTTMERQF